MGRQNRRRLNREARNSPRHRMLERKGVKEPDETGHTRGHFCGPYIHQPRGNILRHPTEGSWLS